MMSGKQNKRMRYSDILTKIKNSLFSKKSREFLVFLFFVFVSFSFWLLQVLDDDYETELAVPLKLKNVPENVVMTSDLPSELRVGVRDRGTVLANYMLGQSFYPLALDFKEYFLRGNHVRIASTDLTRRISSQLNQSTKILSIDPDTIEFIYMQGRGKKVPVVLQGEVRAERQYYISGISCLPDSVMVYAPRSISDTIHAAYTQPVMVDHVSDTTHLRVGFMPIKGVRYIPSYSDIALMADIYSEKSLEVPVRGVGFPRDKILRTFPSKVKVTFQVGLSRFKDISPDDFSVEVNYKDLEDRKDEKCRPVLHVLSPYVNHAYTTPEKIDFIIEQQVVPYE